VQDLNDLPLDDITGSFARVGVEFLEFALRWHGRHAHISDRWGADIEHLDRSTTLNIRRTVSLDGGSRQARAGRYRPPVLPPTVEIGLPVVKPPKRTARRPSASVAVPSAADSSVMPPGMLDSPVHRTEFLSIPEVT
jgi:hypothetical protein